MSLPSYDTNRRVLACAAMNYAGARRVLHLLRVHSDDLTEQEYRTLRGQAINGDADGAEKGLHTLLSRKGVIP